MVSDKQMVTRSPQLNTWFWLPVIAFAMGGTGLVYFTFITAPMFSGFHDSLPLAIRVVMFVGPYGWLAVALLGALVTLQVPSTTWKFISTMLFLSLVIGVLCILLFTNVECPTTIARP